jgi:hypothetical protein
LRECTGGIAFKTRPSTQPATSTSASTHTAGGTVLLLMATYSAVRFRRKIRNQRALTSNMPRFYFVVSESPIYASKTPHSTLQSYCPSLSPPLTGAYDCLTRLLSLHCSTQGLTAAHANNPTVANMNMSITAWSFVLSRWKQSVNTLSSVASLHIDSS